jgi:hypothetical protein
MRTLRRGLGADKFLALFPYFFPPQLAAARHHWMTTWPGPRRLAHPEGGMLAELRGEVPDADFARALLAAGRRAPVQVGNEKGECQVSVSLVGDPWSITRSARCASKERVTR